MNTLDDLTTSLDAYAQRDTPRGADAVWAAATEAMPLAVPEVAARPPRRLPLVAAAAVAACFLLVAALAVRAEHEVDVSTTPSPGSVPGPASSALPTVSVPATPGPASIVLVADRPPQDGEFAPVALEGLPAGADVTVQACLVSPDAGDVCDQRVEPDPLPVIHVDEAVHEGPLVTGWWVRRSIYDTRWHDCGVEACELRVYPVGADGRVDRSSILARTPLTIEGSGVIIRPSLRRADGAAIQPGDTVKILGEAFPPGATLRLRFCPTGPQSADCVDDGAEAARVADDGTVELRFTFPSTTLGPDGAIDCASDRGVCMLAVFPDEQSIETYAATLLDVVPFNVGTVPGTMPP